MKESDRKFIATTARDYDLSFDTVKKIFDFYYDAGCFYEKLEEEISSCV